MDSVRHYTHLLCSPVRSCTFPVVPVCSCALYMHPNWPLLEIILQSRAILCVQYGLESAFVVDYLIPSYLDVRYGLKSVLECPIIIFASLLIGILMPHYVYHNYPIWNLNAISYWKLSQLILGSVIVEKMKNPLQGIFSYFDTRVPTPNKKPFIHFLIFPPCFCSYL